MNHVNKYIRGVAHTSLVEVLLELLSGSMITETDGIGSRLHLTVGKILAEEVERTVTSSRFLLSVKMGCKHLPGRSWG